MTALPSDSTLSTGSDTSRSNSLRSIRLVAACIMTGFVATSTILYCCLEHMEPTDLRNLLSSRATPSLRVPREDLTVSSEIPVMTADWGLPNTRDLVSSTSSSVRSPFRQSMTRSRRELFEQDFSPDDLERTLMVVEQLRVKEPDVPTMDLE